MTEQPTPYGEPAAPQPTSTYATWGDRVIANLWDFVYLWPAFVAFIGSMVAVAIGAVMAQSDGSETLGGTVAVVAGIGAFAAYIWMVVRMLRNYITLQGRTGQTWGKAKKGLWVVDEATGAVPGWPSCLGRYLLHLVINYALYIDYLWPLWDQPRRQTLTDKILGTVVVKRA